jgi:hypothetical protein
MGAAKGVGSCQRAARKAVLWCFFAVFQVQSRGFFLNRPEKTGAEKTIFRFFE